MKDVYVARQPIYDNDITVIGYELLYRANVGDSAGIVDTTAAATALLNAFVEIGLDKLVGSKPAFVNLGSSHLTGEVVAALPKERVVLEVLESISVNAEVVSTVQSFKSSGYRIALDDFVLTSETEPLVPLADIVKIDVKDKSESELALACKSLRRFPAKLLAEKVETYDCFETCKKLGFDLFQGYFFCRPKVVQGRQAPANRKAAMQLLARLQDPDVALDDLALLLSGDVALCYKLLRCINSAAYALPRRVESVQDALLFLGTSVVRTWASLLLLTGVEAKPSQLMTTAIVRANQCKLLAQAIGETGLDRFFTVGLFSVLDALMDARMEDVIVSLPLSDEIKSALVDPTEQTSLAATLRRVIAYEQGKWESVEEEALGAAIITSTYLESVSRAEEVCDFLAAA